MEIKIKFLKFWSDWTDIVEETINTDDYDFFELEFRFGYAVYLYGHKDGDRIDINQLFGQNELCNPSEVYTALFDQIRKINSYYGGEGFITALQRTIPKTVWEHQDTQN